MTEAEMKQAALEAARELASDSAHIPLIAAMIENKFKKLIMRSPITTEDLQNRYDTNAAIKELADKLHDHSTKVEGWSWSARECISCLKMAIYQVDGDERVYTDHWLETGPGPEPGSAEWKRNLGLA